MYELIISLDAVLKFLTNGTRGWEYNVSQSTINVRDKILAAKDIDLITAAGFNNRLTQQEVEAQFNRINFLTDHTSVTSDNKTLFLIH